MFGTQGAVIGFALLLSGTGLTAGHAEVAPRLIELSAPAPSWWNPDVAAAAREAASRGLLYNPLTHTFHSPAAAPAGGIPYGGPDYLFIRPGALFLGGGVLCTYNFIYDNFTKIGTAGHCVGGPGQVVYIVAAPPLVTALGTVASRENAGIGRDWALINIDPQWAPYVDPNMAYLGGPSCSAWTGAGGIGKHTGHGIQTGLVASVPRLSLISGGDGSRFDATGEISSGDSGSAMVHVGGNVTACSGGSAAGVNTHCASITGTECLPLIVGTDIRHVPATVTPGFDPL